MAEEAAGRVWRLPPWTRRWRLTGSVGDMGGGVADAREAESVWPVFAFPNDGDPTARSYLQERLAAIGPGPTALVKRFDANRTCRAAGAADRAGRLPGVVVPAGEREPFVSRLLVLYRDDPDSGLHSAIDWLLRQKWGKLEELAAIDAEFAARLAPGWWRVRWR